MSAAERPPLTYDVTDYDVPVDPASLVDCEGCQ
jgi:hypothetical protein